MEIAGINENLITVRNFNNSSSFIIMDIIRYYNKNNFGYVCVWQIL